MENVAQVPEPEIDDVDQALVDALWKTHRAFYIFSLGSALALGAVIAGLLVVFDPSSTSISQNDASLLLVFVPLIFPVAVNLRLGSQVQHEMVLQITQSLGFTYTQSAPLPPGESVTFGVGHARRLYDVMTGVYREFPMRIFSYTYSVGYGKSERTYEETIMEFTYPAALPHLILGPHALFAREEMHVPSDVETVQLEGDFGAHFSLFAAKGAQLEAREIFEPDLMQSLIADYTNYHFEIVGTAFYFVYSSTFTKRADLLGMRDKADQLMDKLIPGLRSAAQDSAAVPKA